MADGTGGLEVIDRWDGGLGWLAHPDEPLQRASHALLADGEMWLVDPVDAPGLDDRLAELGAVAGVVVALDRHRRDAVALAERHDVAVHLAGPLAGVAGDLATRTEFLDGTLGETGYRTLPVVDNRFWREVALHDPRGGTLLVPEAVGTAPFFRAGGERLGVHPALRLRPPRRRLGGLSPARVLVGHGRGVHEDATSALAEALGSARRNAPRLYARAIRDAVSGRFR